MATVIMRCNCTANKEGNISGAKSQDKLYGRGMRVHNTMGDDNQKFRCTVCGNERGKSNK